MKYFKTFEDISKGVQIEDEFEQAELTRKKEELYDKEVESQLKEDDKKLQKRLKKVAKNR